MRNGKAAAVGWQEQTPRTHLNPKLLFVHVVVKSKGKNNDKSSRQHIQDWHFHTPLFTVCAWQSYHDRDPKEIQA
jgi:hypothetical protein